MSGRFQKILLALLAALLLLGSSSVQKSLNLQRAAFGLTRMEPLKNAPPILVFTTVALGGFRGLISNALWVRLSSLQEENKFFEMAQLADWITKLEPHFAMVWRFQAWNMSYNISVKFKDPADRWRWVKRGMELLRDDGIRFNPGDPELYHELGWHFYHKMGWDLDDAHFYFKQAWADEMKPIFGTGPVNLEAIAHPRSDADREKRRMLVEKYKMDPELMLTVDRDYGPLEWRLPESHAIYWAVLGIQKSQSKNLIQLRRLIFHSMKLAFQRGKLSFTPDGKIRLSPDWESFARVNAAYEKMMAVDPDEAYKITQGHRNFLREAVEYLYVHDRRALAQQWFDYMKQKYPDGPTAPNQTMEEFVMSRFTENLASLSRDQVNARIEGLLINYFDSLITEDEQMAPLYTIAKQLWQRYMAKRDQERTRLEPFEKIRDLVLARMLDPETGLPPDRANRLRTALNLPADFPSKK